MDYGDEDVGVLRKRISELESLLGLCRQALHQKQEKFVESSLDAVKMADRGRYFMIVDNIGKIVFASNSLLKLLNYGNEGLSGKNYAEVSAESGTDIHDFFVREGVVGERELYLMPSYTDAIQEDREDYGIKTAAEAKQFFCYKLLSFIYSPDIKKEGPLSLIGRFMKEFKRRTKKLKPLKGSERIIISESDSTQKEDKAD